MTELNTDVQKLSNFQSLKKSCLLNENTTYIEKFIATNTFTSISLITKSIIFKVNIIFNYVLQMENITNILKYAVIILSLQPSTNFSIKQLTYIKFCIQNKSFFPNKESLLGTRTRDFISHNF